VEGQFEAHLIKIAIERRLTSSEVNRLGRFREGYQQLRESIEEGVDLPFRVQHSAEAHNAYVAFKALSVQFAALLGGRGWMWRRPFLPIRMMRPTRWQGQQAFVRVNSWRTAAGTDKNLWWSDPGGA
jgi:hypothetical protein